MSDCGWETYGLLSWPQTLVCSPPPERLRSPSPQSRAACVCSWCTKDRQVPGQSGMPWRPGLPDRLGYLLGRSGRPRGRAVLSGKRRSGSGVYKGAVLASEVSWSLGRAGKKRDMLKGSLGGDRCTDAWENWALGLRPWSPLCRLMLDLRTVAAWLRWPAAPRQPASPSAL